MIEYKVEKYNTDNTDTMSTAMMERNEDGYQVAGIDVLNENYVMVTYVKHKPDTIKYCNQLIAELEAKKKEIGDAEQTEDSTDEQLELFGDEAGQTS
jgi:hypothetical protein